MGSVPSTTMESSKISSSYSGSMGVTRFLFVLQEKTIKNETMAKYKENFMLLFDLLAAKMQKSNDLAIIISIFIFNIAQIIAN
jgi:hypothetical protein